MVHVGFHQFRKNIASMLREYNMRKLNRYKRWQSKGGSHGSVQQQRVWIVSRVLLCPQQIQFESLSDRHHSNDTDNAEKTHNSTNPATERNIHNELPWFFSRLIMTFGHETRWANSSNPERYNTIDYSYPNSVAKYWSKCSSRSPSWSTRRCLWHARNYLADYCCLFTDDARPRRLHSADTRTLLVSQTRTTFSDKSHTAAGPQVCNYL